MARKVTLRRVLTSLVSLSMLGLLVLAFRPTPLRVDLGPVKRGALQVTVDAEGKTRLRHRFVVSAPIAGRLARLTLREGDTVETDHVIAHIDPLPTDAAVREAQARLTEWRAQRAGVATLRPKDEAFAQARARIAAAQSAQRKAEARVEQMRAMLEQARREHQRAARLEATGTLSREARETAQLTEATRLKDLEATTLEVQGAAAEVEAARAALAVLEAQRRDPDYLLDVYSARIASVEAELARLRDDAARAEIRAPGRGRVLRVLQENERAVAAGTPLLEVGDVHDMELVVDVLSTDAVRIQPDMAVRIEHWGGPEALQARIRLVEPAAFTKVSALGIEEQRVNVLVDFVDPAVPLGDGYRVEARIIVWEHPQVLQVPLSALFRCQEAWCVFTAGDGRAQRRHVQLGQRSAFIAEITHGLTEGDTVILHPSEQVTDGSRIQARDEPRR